jgi:hypothetical protein
MRVIAELDLGLVRGGKEALSRGTPDLKGLVEPVSGAGPTAVSNAEFQRALKACFVDFPRCQGVSRNSGEIHEFREGRWGPPGRPI